MMHFNIIIMKTYPTTVHTLVTFYMYRQSCLPTGQDRPCGFQVFEGPRSQENWHMVLKLSGPKQRPPLPPENKPGTYFS